MTWKLPVTAGGAPPAPRGRPALDSRQKEAKEPLEREESQMGAKFRGKPATVSHESIWILGPSCTR